VYGFAPERAVAPGFRGRRLKVTSLNSKYFSAVMVKVRQPWVPLPQLLEGMDIEKLLLISFSRLLMDSWLGMST
jgi:hypothetical protein